MEKLNLVRTWRGRMSSSSEYPIVESNYVQHGDLMWFSGGMDAGGEPYHLNPATGEEVTLNELSKLIETLKWVREEMKNPESELFKGDLYGKVAARHYGVEKATPQQRASIKKYLFLQLYGRHD